MKSKHYTIIISPSDLKPAKKLTVHRATIFMAVVTVLILTCCGMLGSYKFAEHSDLKLQLEEAKNDIFELREANQILIRSKEKERRVREFLGLGRTIEVPGEPGQGGPGADSYGLEDLKPYSPETVRPQSQLLKVEKRLSAVDEALVLEEDYQELLDYIEEQNNDLAVVPTISPVVVPNAWISSSYGYRKSPFTGAREFHSGLDISAPRGTPILATGEGKVIFAGRNGAVGKCVKISHNGEYVTLYGHMLEIKVKKRQSVKRGDVIGLMGKTGRSTGYHVHYEVRKNGKTVNPYHYVLNWRDRHLLAEQMAQGVER